MKIIIYCEANSERQYYKAVCDHMDVATQVVSNTTEFKRALELDNFQLVLLSLHLVDIRNLHKRARQIREYPYCSDDGK